MEMISRELRAGLPLELLYADDLISMAEIKESLHDKIVKWKSGLEAKRFEDEYRKNEGNVHL